VRIDLRQGVDMPINPLKPNKMPSMYFEVAWSEGLHESSIVPETKLISMAVDDNRHPNWNQQVILNNPPSQTEPKGFIWVSLKDRDMMNNEIVE
jgi:hypothetical protein